MLRAEDRAEEVLSDTTEHGAGDEGYRIDVAGGLDRHAAEALRLELERLARTEGIALTVTIRRAGATPESS
jgi:hypothetical protein